MSTPLHPVLVNWAAAGLVGGLLAVLLLRSPPRRLRAPLMLYQGFVLMYILGDAITLLSREMWVEQLGIMTLYTGALWAPAACWVVAVRYPQVQGLPGAWAPAWTTRAAIAATAVAWVVAVTNPWHGRFLIPVIGDHNIHLALWRPAVTVGWILAWASVLRFLSLSYKTDDPCVARNARIMAGGLTIAMTANWASVNYSDVVPFDVTTAGLGATSLVMLYGVYRTRLFAVLPVAEREVLRHHPDALLVTGLDGRLLSVNPAGRRLLGLEDQPLEGEGDGYSILSARVSRADGGRFDARAEIPLLAQNGEEVSLRDAVGRFLELSITEVPVAGGRAGAYALRISDVSRLQRAAAAVRQERDALEERVAERTRELRESETRYRAVSQLSSDASFALRLEAGGRIVPEWYTDAITQVTGYGLEDLERLGWDAPLYPGERERVERELAPVLEGRGPVRVEVRLQGMDGTLRWIELLADTLQRESDGALRLLGAVRDITTQRQAEEERRALEDRMRDAQRLESLGVLAGGIAHDFNNLLSVVLGNSVLALQALDDRAALRKRLERIRSAGRYAAQLTDQMLTYAGRSTPKLTGLDLSAVILEIEDLLDAATAGTCGVELEPSRGLPPVLCDAVQIQQVVMNLVGNACEASSESARPVRLRTGVERRDMSWLRSAAIRPQRLVDEYVWIEVEDSGSGMDAATRGRIFDPFYTTRFDGRGLGLAVVHGIVRAHDGALCVDSEPGRGTRFRVLLPRADVVPYREAAPPPVPVPLGDGSVVLVVDDDPDVREVAVRFLERGGYRVRTASSGSDALDVCSAPDCDVRLVLLDLSMPGIDGEETLRRLRERRPGLPIILTSGFPEASVAARFDGATRPSGFLSKPFEPGTLLARVHAVLAELDGR